MTIKEKRKRLADYCENNHCYDCKLNTKRFHCGRGYSFTGKNEVNDDEVIEGYDLLFNEHEEPMMTIETLKKSFDAAVIKTIEELAEDFTKRVDADPMSSVVLGITATMVASKIRANLFNEESEGNKA